MGYMMQKGFLGQREKKWVIREDESPLSSAETAQLAQELGRSEIVTRLLCLRGYKDVKSANDFLYMKTEMLCDPFAMKDMDAAVERIRRAIEKKEKIVIYGDYDVDGVTAVCTLYLFLRSHGAQVSYYIPNRIGEGYGVSVQAVDKLIAEGSNLIITVDTGITASEEVAHAKACGVDFVITDHHECRTELPDAVAVVNPHRPDDTYPFRDLAGVGVVFKLLCALETRLNGEPLMDAVRTVCREYADLVAIGTIADVMPVKGENKIIVKYGLSMIEKTERPGLRALLDAVSAPADERARTKKKSKISSGYIGYTIAPRINAAGRIRSASIAVELFLSEDPVQAQKLAEELCVANKERQLQENSIMQEAYAKIEEEHDFEHDPVIVLDADHWHHGVIGIVCSRITEHYGLPSILVSFEGSEGQGNEDIGKGSGRSIKGLNLVDALVHCSEHLVKFGGHELAAGLSVTRANLPAFREAINRYAREILSEESITPTLDADMEVSPNDITMDLAEELQLLEPYGIGNPVPTFVLRDMELAECIPISGGKHTRLVVARDGKYYQAMFFSRTQSELNLFVGDRVDLVFTLDINEYNGRRNVQLIGRDIRLSTAEQARRETEKERFARIWEGEPFSDTDIVPTRDDFAAVYTLVRRNVRLGIEDMSHRALLTKLHAGQQGNRIGYVKLKLIIRILQELNLLGLEEISDEFYHFHLNYFDTKTDLEKSNLLRRLRTQYRQA
jgi:single-stranded-DNA-specific exonuclease